MVFECDHDVGHDSKNWPKHIKDYADLRQLLHEDRMAQEGFVLDQVIERCECVGNIFFLSRDLKFEPAAIGPSKAEGGE